MASKSENTPADPAVRPGGEYPIGVIIGVGVERTQIGEVEYLVDPVGGWITGVA